MKKKEREREKKKTGFRLVVCFRTLSVNLLDARQRLLSVGAFALSLGGETRVVLSFSFYSQKRQRADCPEIKLDSTHLFLLSAKRLPISPTRTPKRLELAARNSRLISFLFPSALADPSPVFEVESATITASQWATSNFRCYRMSQPTAVSDPQASPRGEGEGT